MTIAGSAICTRCVGSGHYFALYCAAVRFRPRDEEDRLRGCECQLVDMILEFRWEKGERKDVLLWQGLVGEWFGSLAFYFLEPLVRFAGTD